MGEMWAYDANWRVKGVFPTAADLLLSTCPYICPDNSIIVQLYASCLMDLSIYIYADLAVAYCVYMQVLLTEYFFFFYCFPYLNSHITNKRSEYSQELKVLFVTKFNFWVSFPTR